jgi:hypothetical protein
MKRLIVVIIVIVAAFGLYTYLSDEGAVRPPSPGSASSSEQAGSPPAVTPSATMPPIFNPTPAPNPPVDARAREIDNVIKQCAARAQVHLDGPIKHGTGISRITAIGDNNAIQRFLTELQDAGIMTDFNELGKSVVASPDPNRPGPYFRVVYEIKWRL